MIKTFQLWSIPCAKRFQVLVSCLLPRFLDIHILMGQEQGHGTCWMLEIRSWFFNYVHFWWFLMEMPHLAIISRIVLTSLSVPGLKPAWAPLWWKSHQYLDANNEAIIIKTHCKFSEGIHIIVVIFSFSLSICLYHHISTPLIIVIIVLASVPE